MSRLHEELWLRAYRNDALSQQGGVCAYCRSRLPRRKATADHVVPRCSGGLNSRENIVAACEPCNLAKGHLSRAQFAKLIKQPDHGAKFGIWRAWMRRRLSLATERACKRIIARAA